MAQYLAYHVILGCFCHCFAKLGVDEGGTPCCRSLVRLAIEDKNVIYRILSSNCGSGCGSGSDAAPSVDILATLVVREGKAIGSLSLFGDF